MQDAILDLEESLYELEESRPRGRLDLRTSRNRLVENNQMNAVEYQLDFQQCPGSCPICYEDKVLVTFHYHSACDECLRDYVAFKLSNTGKALIICPIKDCVVQLPSSFTVNYCPTDLLPNFKRYQERDELMSNPFVKFCPVPDCEGYDLSGLSKNLTCRTCGHHYCAYCQEPWHSSLCKNALDQQFERWAFWSNVKHCPSCGFRIEKNGGCPHMTCSQCSTGFCWFCGLKDSEHSECVYVTEQLKNPDWMYLTGLVLSPITFLLAFIIFYLFVKSQVPQDQQPTNWVEKIVLFLIRHPYFACCLLLVLTPLLWVLVPLFLTWVFVTELCSNFYYRRPKLYYPLIVVLLPLGYVLLLILILAVVVLAMPVGLGFVVWKGIIWAIRKKNPGFMKRKIRLGF